MITVVILYMAIISMAIIDMAIITIAILDGGALPDVCERARSRKLTPCWCLAWGIIHQYPPKWSHFSIAICGFGCFWGTTIFGNIHLFILINLYLFLFIYIYLRRMAQCWNYTPHEVGCSSGSQEWSSTTGCIWCWQAGERLGAKNANPENTASRPNTRLFFMGFLDFFANPFEHMEAWKIQGHI